MADFNLGVYRPRPMGTYNPTTNYRYLDIVKYTGGSYININLDTIDGTSCIGILPIGQGQSEAYWQCLAEKGDKGDIADSYTPYVTVMNGTWDYSISDKIIVPDNGSLSISIANAYDGCCGIIISKKELTLPSNSLFSADFNYVPTKTSDDYYFYTFTYAILNGSGTFLWHRSVMNHGN